MSDNPVEASVILVSSSLVFFFGGGGGGFCTVDVY